MSQEASRWEVPEAAGGERLDRHVAAHLDVPRNQVQQWIRDGRVELDGTPAKAATPLIPGQRIVARPPPRRDSRLRPEAGALPLVHTDEALVVVDKPAGMVVHPGAGHPTGTLAHLLLAHYPELEGVGGPGRPGIVHRLDKGTSGVMVVARTPQAYRALTEAFAERRVIKRYLAVVHGRAAPEGAVSRPIGRHPRRRQEMAVTAAGRPALTRYRRLAEATEARVCLLEVDLATGRTHQIRVHLKSLHMPLVGDPTYGEARFKEAPKRLRAPLEAFERPALHAWRLTLPHPGDGQQRVYEAPPPADLAGLWRALTGEALGECLPRRRGPDAAWPEG